MAYGHEYDFPHRSGMGTFWAMVLGMTVGAVGTAVLLAMNEKRFHYVVEETKNMGRKLEDRMEEGMDVAKNAAGDVAETAEHGARKVKSSFRDNNMNA
jgi:hypothetical protein